ncbi:MAG: DUF2752 domain-containing protein [Myxococcota bacterium]
MSAPAPPNAPVDAAYASPNDGQVQARGTRLSRIVWFFLWAIPLAIVITATTITPAAEGHGTHTQLGLPPCGFLQATGIPCPGCGLTTSFAHMVRFQFTGASMANAFGVALFLVSVFAIPVGIYAMVRGLPVFETLERLQFEKIVVMLAVCSTLVWVIRVGNILL